MYGRMTESTHWLVNVSVCFFFSRFILSHKTEQILNQFHKMNVFMIKVFLWQSRFARKFRFSIRISARNELQKYFFAFVRCRDAEYGACSTTIKAKLNSAQTQRYGFVAWMKIQLIFVLFVRNVCSIVEHGVFQLNVHMLESRAMCRNCLLHCRLRTEHFLISMDWFSEENILQNIRNGL